MTRSAFSKVIRAGRATIFMVGLAVVLALVFGVATTAFSATGANLVLGRFNAAETPTSLVSTLTDAAKPALNVHNKSGGPALNLGVARDQAPIKVNAAADTATNLSADELDGKDSSAFYAAGSKVADSSHADQADSATSAGDANTFDGKDSSEFLSRTEKAADADQLDGKDSTDFAPKSAEGWRELSRIIDSYDPDGYLFWYGCCGAQSGWSNFDNNHNKAGYYKDPYGVVHLKGVVRWEMQSAGADNRWWAYKITELPQGYRPSHREVHVTLSNNQLGRINIDPDGSVKTENLGDGTQWISLDGITFRAAN